MAKKTLSFAEKAAKKNKKSDIKYVKYVGSVRSEKTGQWRFNERMIGLQGGESLDAALKRIDEEKKLLNIELPDPDQVQVESEKVESSAHVESATIEDAGETVEVAEEGESTEEALEAVETEEDMVDEGEDTMEETVEVAEEGEFTEEASDAEETVETEEVGLSETAEDSGQEIDEEPGETDLEENKTPKSKDALKEGSSEQKQKE